ncbi:YhjD/YihY/BrkB family envelope integrity protein [Spirochaeta africana]|uniref:Putative membrane protein n=1 Tax=Spirochaeta africana (strain ATCC 700263 / DSM 8902 / Z-7692) TaxID=889378 RepID=H9UGT0_SPIAZ|nr:YhjD/YihY/BrkB family envelope integrity protein [Spirochaeta africana]AFG36723.1 putative membrane protein [Spirochaeta africana DSM 8902]
MRQALRAYFTREKLDELLHLRERWRHRLRFFRIYTDNNGALLAKGIAFSLLFGSIPLLLLLVSLRSVFFFPEFSAILEGQILDFLPDDIKYQVMNVILGSEYRFSSLDVVTIGALLFAVNSLFTDLGTGMATMLDAPIVKNWLHRLIAIPLMLAFLLLFYLASVLTPGLNLVRQFFVVAPGVSRLVSRLISIGIYTFIMTGLYYLFSGRHLRFIPTVVIGALSAVVWQGLNILGSYIVFGLGSRLLLLGAVASLMIILFYMRVLADIFLMSSVLVRIYAIPQGIAESEAALEHRWSPVRLWRYLTAGVGPSDEAEEGDGAAGKPQAEAEAAGGAGETGADADGCRADTDSSAP